MLIERVLILLITLETEIKFSGFVEKNHVLEWLWQYFKFERIETFYFGNFL